MPERSLPTIGVPGTSGSGGNSGKVPKWFKIGYITNALDRFNCT